MAVFNQNLQRANGMSPRKINCSSGSGGDKEAAAELGKPTITLESKLSAYLDAKES